MLLRTQRPLKELDKRPLLSLPGLNYKSVKSICKKIFRVSGSITRATNQVKVSFNASIISKDSSIIFDRFGLLVKGMSNVVVRHIAVKKVQCSRGKEWYHRDSEIQ
jgi:pectate lyase